MTVVKRICAVSILIAVLLSSSCVSTSPGDIVFDGAEERLARVYIYMPKYVKIRGAAEEEEFLYINGEELGSVRPGSSIGFLYEPGFVTVTTKGQYQEKLERRFFLNPGEKLFIAMEKGLNLRDSGFLFYRKSLEEGLAGIKRTHYRSVTPGEALQ